MSDIAWLIICAALVLLMQAGFMGLESGLTRNKNSVNVAIKNLVDLGISIILFWLIGYAFMFGKSWQGWLGTTQYLFNPDPQNLWESAFFIFQMAFCSTAVTITSGATAERMKFISYLIIAGLIASIIYPVFGHWAWYHAESQMGWLKQLGFIDFAGSTVVHGIGGWASLAMLLIIGPRHGRFADNKKVYRIYSSNMPLAIFGVIFIWIGWFGFNGGSALVFDNSIGGILINTLLAGSSGMLVALEVDWLWRRQARVETLTNGCLAGLVAITASCHAVTALAALVIGGIGGIVMILSTYLLERWHIDDAVGAVPVHAFAGVWGTLAVAFFASPDFFGESVSRVAQLKIQLIGIFSCFAWAFGFSFIIFKIMNIFLPLRVSKEAEEEGLNISEHGATTGLYHLLNAMEQQALTGNIDKRLPEEPFTDEGKIAFRHNRVLDRLNEEMETVRQLAEIARKAQEEAEAASDKLKTKLEELKLFNQVATNRELRMIELKREINVLTLQLGELPHYDLSFVDNPTASTKISNYQKVDSDNND